MKYLLFIHPYPKLYASFVYFGKVALTSDLFYCDKSLKSQPQP